jgi:thiamine biosynthesis lipoprotein
MRRNSGTSRLAAYHDLAEEFSDLAVPAGMARERFHAMGTTVSLLLPEARSSDGKRAVQALFEEWEETLSRFRPDSELSCLNGHAGATVAVSPLLFHVLQTALEAAESTDGAYDPTLQRQITDLGYDRTFDEVIATEEHDGHLLELPAGDAERATPGGGWRRIRLDRQRGEVTLPGDVGVDFGGIAKGLAVDESLVRLRLIGIEAAMVNAGGDLSVRGLPPQLDCWPVVVQGIDRAWTIPLRNGAIATSGIARRHWSQNGSERHHLIDPKTGMPAASGLWAVSAVARVCGQAEVAAKTAFIRGPVGGRVFLESHGLAGLLIQSDGGLITAGNLPLTEMKDEI